MSNTNMNVIEELRQNARALQFKERVRILESFKETDLHQHLKELFSNMEKKYLIEITHGASELGKDLVIIRKDKFKTDVTAVIVKKGDISGKTCGDTDEVRERIIKIENYKGRKYKDIKSQIKQASTHPAELKYFLNTLPVTEIIVALFGKISGQARDRLRKECSLNVTFFDMARLVEDFTEYYPQIFFEGKTLDYLQKSIQYLETKYSFKDRFNNQNFNLSEYFVEPIVSSSDFPIEFDERKLATMIKKRKLPFSELRKTIERYRKIVIIGDPGVGKSGAVAKLAVDLMRKSCDLVIKKEGKNKINIPLLIIAKDFLEIKDSDDLLKKVIIDNQVIERFNVNILLIDGLDEIDFKDRNKLIEKANSISNDLNSSIVITSRRISSIDILPEGYNKFELLPFEFNQAITLFEKLDPNKKIFNELKAGLEKIVKKIPMMPLSLMLLMKLVEEYKEIPASITELYDEFFDIALGKFDKDKGIEVLFEYRIKKIFLAELAYFEFLKKDRLDIGKQDFNEFLNNFNKKYGLRIDKPDDFLKEIERSGILDIRELVRFCHRSFLDYFAAYYIYHDQIKINNLNNLITRLYFHDIWFDVSFFFIGLNRKIDLEILEEIFSYNGDDLMTIVDKFTCGRLIQAGWFSEESIKLTAISKAISFVPILREKLIKSFPGKVSVPKIIHDFFIMKSAEDSFASIFMNKQVKIIFNDLSKEPTPDNIYKMLALLWSIQRFLSKDEIDKSIDSLLEISSGNILSVESAGVLLLFLIIIERKDKKFIKVIDRKLRKLIKKHPGVFRKMLPKY